MSVASLDPLTPHAGDRGRESELRTETWGEGGGPPRASVGAGDIPRGTQVGRYIVLTLRGRGAMGDVYAAYDPELDRKVALKLLRFDHADIDRSARLIREARALARLSHPNVITLYDVGTWDGEVFLAMELIDGVELGTWLAARKGQWAAIRAAFVAAGRGLAAAHAVGLVHRDFKPANVLVAENGAIKVLDFGVATAATNAARVTLTAGSPTRSHTVAGTPAYMAPEVHEGAVADARADQYSFCVAFHEALHGRRPFHGEDAAELQANKQRGRLPPGLAAVPRELQKIVARGLAPSPDDRFAAMPELLARLERVPSRRGRIAALAGVAVGVAAAAGSLWSGGGVDPAVEGASQVAAVWSASARDSVRDALLASDAPYAGSAWRSVQAMIDAHAREWVDAYADARTATERRGDQSAAMMDLRIGCLRGRLAELRALVGVLADRSAPAVEHAVTAAAKLTPIAGCADVEALAAELPPPAPAVAAGVTAVRERLATVEALEHVGRYAQARELAIAAAAEAESLAYEPLIAEAQLRLGLTRLDMGEIAAAEAAMLGSAELAERIGYATLEARGAIEILYLIGFQQVRIAEAALWSRHARAAALRRGVPEHVRATLFDVLGAVGVASGRYADAREAYTSARALHERLEGPGSTALAGTLHGLALLELRRDDTAAALEHAERSLSLVEGAFGPEHPQVGVALLALGAILERRGALDAAVHARRRSLAILTRALGPEYVGLARAHNALGATLARQGHHAEGREHCERALAMWRAALGDEHPILAQAWSALGRISLQTGDAEQAERLFRRVLTSEEKVRGPTHPELAINLRDLADSLTRLDRCEDALPLLTRAAAIYSEHGLVDTGRTAEVQASRDEALRCLARRGAGDAVTALADPPRR